MRPGRQIHVWLSRVGKAIRSILGVPDYERYLAHIQRFHPGMDPVSRTDFARETSLERRGRVGSATALLLPQRPLVDYAMGWMERNRK